MYRSRLSVYNFERNEVSEVLYHHIVIHTASRELELYEYGRLVARYPIAVGKAETPTPHGQFYIAEKILHPGGMFGTRWLGLSIDGYGIHGTNNPSSIGKAVSLGCIRMYNHDVEALYDRVNIGTPVTITA